MAIAIFVVVAIFVAVAIFVVIVGVMVVVGIGVARAAPISISIIVSIFVPIAITANTISKDHPGGNEDAIGIVIAFDGHRRTGSRRTDDLSGAHIHVLAVDDPEVAVHILEDAFQFGLGILDRLPFGIDRWPGNRSERATTTLQLGCVEGGT